MIPDGFSFLLPATPSFPFITSQKLFFYVAHVNSILGTYNNLIKRIFRLSQLSQNNIQSIINNRFKWQNTFFSVSG